MYVIVVFSYSYCTFCYINIVNAILKILKIDGAFLFFLTLAGNFSKTQEQPEVTVAYE